MSINPNGRMARAIILAARFNVGVGYWLVPGLLMFLCYLPLALMSTGASFVINGLWTVLLAYITGAAFGVWRLDRRSR